MTETADDLSAPLGQDKPRRKRRLRLPFTAMQALAVLLGLFLVAFAGFAIFNKDPLGGEPMRARSRSAPQPRPPTRSRPPRRPCARTAGRTSTRPRTQPKQAGEQKTVTMIDGSSGTRHDVVIGGDAADKAEAATASARRRHGRDRPTTAGKIALWHDPRDGRRTEAFQRLCGRCRPRQGRQDAGGRDRDRRPWRRRRQDHRRHHEAAAGGDAGLHALWLRSRQTRRARPRPAPRDLPPDPDGALRLSRQRSGTADAADLARAPSRTSTACTGT